MKKVIVTTTINPPTDAIRQYDEMKDWDLIVVGDRKTPEYKLRRGQFISWEEQQGRYPAFCDLLGPDSIARGRMIAFIEGYKTGAKILASIDDDNYPKDNWGDEILIGQETEVTKYVPKNGLCFDPLSIFSVPAVHRGFPLELSPSNTFSYYTNEKIIPKVQASLWDGELDVDAIYRLHSNTKYSLNACLPFFTESFSPFNTQNTFFDTKYLKDFFANIPFIGRADDIWAAYLFEKEHPSSVVYTSSTVVHKQERTVKSLVNDLENEIFAYKNTYDFLEALACEKKVKVMEKFLPEKALFAVDLYRGYFS